jgi:ribose-phosphate pyrophosphokinase
MQILSGTSNNKLAQDLAEKLNASILKREITQFADGEIKIQITETIKKPSVTLVQTLSPPVNHTIVETLLLIDALVTMKVGEIVLIIPWMGYSIQNRSFRTGEPISARAVAQIFSHPQIKKIILLDLHRSNILEYFKRPVVELSAANLFSSYLSKHIQITDLCIVSPDEGSAHMGKKLADDFSLEHIIVQKKRSLETGETRFLGSIGKSSKKNAIIIDDGVLSGGTIAHSVSFLKAQGFHTIYCMTTHAVLTPGAIKKLNMLELASFICTDSVFQETYPDRTVILPTAQLYLPHIR